jgi:hypothetical protein
MTTLSPSRAPLGLTIAAWAVIVAVLVVLVVTVILMFVGQA